TSTSLSVFYSKDDEIDIYANNFLDIGDILSEESLITGVDAFNQLLDHYSEVLLSNKTKLLSMELSYIAIYKGDEKYELIPTWVFEVAEELEWIDHESEE